MKSELTERQTCSGRASTQQDSRQSCDKQLMATARHHHWDWRSDETR